jgi:hypothetical protein
MSNCHAIEDIGVDPTAHVHPAAVLVGDTIIDVDGHIGHGVVIHGMHIG